MFGKNIFEEALNLYAGSHVVERVRKNRHAALQRSCEEVDLILLVQDVKPFTSFSENLTPARLHEMMCEYLDLMTECIGQCGGIIDHIRGDSIVAYWESLDPCGALAAVKRAGNIGKDLSAKWTKFLPGPLVPLHGVEAGKVMRGNFGAKHRVNFSVVGDVVNFTVRLCSANNSFQTRSLFSHRIRHLAGNPSELRFVDSIVVKGRVNKEDLYTLDSPSPPPPPQA